MQLTIVGSGTVVPSGDRVCSSYHIETGPHRILMDCGPGAVHHLARFGLDWSGLTHVTLTHFHTDHIGDLPMLFFALRHGLREPRTEPLTMLGPVGTRELMGRLADAFGEHLRDTRFALTIHELRDGDAVDLDASTAIRARATPHTDTSLAYRLESPGAVFGYTGDTGPSDEVGDFMRGVDLLVAECSLPDVDAIPTHLSPASVAAMARRAEPRRLVLTHVYPQLDRTTLPDLVRDAGWNGEVGVADDAMRVDI